MAQAVETHELDIWPVLKSHEDRDALVLFQECQAVLCCEDSSLEERIEVAMKIREYMERKIGDVHWVNTYCCEGECEVCNAHPTAS